MKFTTEYELVNTIISLFIGFLNKGKTWNEIHYWVIDNEDYFTEENPYFDLIEEFERMFLSDENDDPQFLANREEVENLLSKFEKRQNEISNIGERAIIKRIKIANTQAENERRMKYINRHLRKHNKKK
jgi:hypothetical protein